MSFNTRDPFTAAIHRQCRAALVLLGGWPGALLAQRLFHHKPLKMPFQLVFWLTAALKLR